MPPEPPQWRVLFLGQGPLAEAAYVQLLELSATTTHRVVVACSNPSSEGTWWGTAGICELASKHGTPFVSNEKRNDALLAERAVERAVNCLISVGHPWVLPELLLGAVEGGTAFNLHNAPLPEYGGFHTASHAILEGATRFGATLHWMEPVPDAGPIAFQERFDVPEDVTARALQHLVLEAGQRLFTRLVTSLADGQLPPRVAMAGAPRLFSRHALDAQREIADLGDAREVDRKARAFWFPPFEPAFHRIGSAKYYVVPSEAMGAPARAR